MRIRLFTGYSPGVGLVDRVNFVRRAATRHLPLTTSADQEVQYWLRLVTCMGLCQPRQFPKIDWMGRFFHLFLRTGSTERERPDA